MKQGDEEKRRVVPAWCWDRCEWGIQTTKKRKFIYQPPKSFVIISRKPLKEGFRLGMACVSLLNCEWQIHRKIRFYMFLYSYTLISWNMQQFLSPGYILRFAIIRIIQSFKRTVDKRVIEDTGMPLLWVEAWKVRVTANHFHVCILSKKFFAWKPSI